MKQHDWKTQFGLATDIINGTSFTLAKIDRKRTKHQELTRDANNILRDSASTPEQKRWARRFLMNGRYKNV
jgi:hypothetical protein